MKIIITLLSILVLTACDHNLKHDRIVKNNSLDTITVYNPDFKDTIFTILPNQEKVIYTFEILDTKQEKEPCRWLGDTLIIKTLSDSLCSKFPSVDSNWVFVMTGTKKERHQTCTFSVDSTDFGF